ncbi:MAG: PP2C family protein-serine/threonine phosphatase [Bacteroidia bacterium]
MKNVYQTDDPHRLLQLKRLEADAMLDVLRTINLTDTNADQLSVIARNVLRAQLGVRKVTFFYEFEDQWREGMRLGFDELSVQALEELILYTKTTKVTAGIAPHLASLGAEYVVPIMNRDAPSAFFVVAEFADSEMETQNDLIFIETLGNIMNVAIRNRQLVNEKLRQESLRRELEVAETIQKQLLISDFSRFREFDVWGFNVPHHRIGGDYFDVIKRGKGNTFVCIADVAGKGIAAALLMSNLQANLRALCAQSDDPIEIVTELNSIIFQVTQGERFISLFLGKIDSETREMEYVNAGHNYPLFLPEKGHLTELSTGAALVGIMPDLNVVSGNLTFEKDDVLLMFTDGVVEQTNLSEEMYGNDRLAELLQSSKGDSSQALVNKVRQDVSYFSEGVEVHDDLTLLSVRFR